MGVINTSMVRYLAYCSFKCLIKDILESRRKKYLKNRTAVSNMIPTMFWAAFLLIISSAYSEENREPRFSIFQIIKFANGPCVGGTRNGTCYTKQECDDVGGTDSGSCADGFGVCCSVVLSPGMSSSLNQTYIVQSGMTAPTAGSMTYTICPCSADVCRIRFDFTTFTLAPPAAPHGEGMPCNAGEAAAIGDCLTDTFSITGPSSGTPIICGVNDGQHMIVDTSSSSCVTVNFGIGSTGDTRNWDIMTTQYRCGEESGGPPGCLQWHMDNTGNVRSFNFPNNARDAAVSDTIVHLSTQRYNICIRRPADTTTICYIPCTYVDATNGGMDANVQQSFGLSIAPSGAANSGVSTSACSTDYIEILGGTSATIAAIAAPATHASSNNLWCGRNFATLNDEGYNAAGNSVCTSVAPFKVRVNFDENEHPANVDPSIDDSNYQDGECNLRPGGIIGFSLCYTTQ